MRVGRHVKTIKPSTGMKHSLRVLSERTTFSSKWWLSHSMPTGHSKNSGIAGKQKPWLQRRLSSGPGGRETDPLERNFSFAPHSTDAEKVSQLLQYYLETEGTLLFYHREVLDELRPPRWEVGLLKPVAGLGSRSPSLRVVTTETAEVYNQLRRFLQR